jgi:hypothetical protein
MMGTLILAAAALLPTAACGSRPDQRDAGAASAALDKPPIGDGVQFGTPSFNIPAGNEEQDCYFFRVSDLAKAGGLDPNQPVRLHRVQLAQKAGSHHMNLFRVRSIVNLDPAKGAVQTGTNGMGECFKSPNWADWPLIANTQQQGDLDWTFPDGVSNTLNSGKSDVEKDEWLMLQTHYVNANSQKTPDAVGQVTVNFWTMKAEDVKYEMGTMFATQQSIRICSQNPTPSFGQGCQLHSQQPVTIVGANGHFHSRGRTFDIFSWDGKTMGTPPDSQRFYQSTQWDDPPMATNINIPIAPGGGVYFTCDFQWTPPTVGCDALNQYDQMKYGTAASAQDCCYTFGPIVEKNEHCNAFVYYYPKTDNVFCN